MSYDIGKITKDLQDKYPDVGIKSIQVDESTGRSTFMLDPTKKSLAFLEKNSVVPRAYSEKASSFSRDVIDRSTLDIAPADPSSETPQNLFKRAMKYYLTEPLVGSTTNLLSNLAPKGMELDIDDQAIKDFYATWMFDVNFDQIIDWIFLDFFKVGSVHTYKVLSKYEPRVSHLSPAPGQKLSKPSKKSKAKGKEIAMEAEKAAKKNIWSKGHLPVSYTVLNPLLVEVESGLLFNSTTVKLTPPNELKDILKKAQSELSEEEKIIIKALPTEVKAAAEKGGDVVLDPRLVGSVSYKKMPYESRGKPRSVKAFDSIEYKNALRNADLSTLDGISNYILKITVGNDEYPVSDQSELEAVAQLFNTPSKSFDVVWNHTLEIEKVVSPEISSILGKGKYEQVNDDLTTGLAMTKALIDGTGTSNAANVGLVIKGIVEEINYARREVERWIYKEFRQIAEAMGFERFPKIRWDEGILRDTIMYMTTLSQLVDRRMLSYNTALESLGFDYQNELKNMENEMPLVEDGVFGIIGSPWQSSGVQPTQGAPSGTPSNGRPKGQPKKTNKKETDPAKKKKTTVKNPKQSEAKIEMSNIVRSMSDEEYEQLIKSLEDIRLDRE